MHPFGGVGRFWQAVGAAVVDTSCLTFLAPSLHLERVGKSLLFDLSYENWVRVNEVWFWNPH